MLGCSEDLSPGCFGAGVPSFGCLWCSYVFIFSALCHCHNSNPECEFPDVSPSHRLLAIGTWVSCPSPISLSFFFLIFIYLAASGLTEALNLSSLHTDSLVVALGFSCSKACGISVPQPGIELASPALQGGFLTTGWPGRPRPISLFQW